MSMRGKCPDAASTRSGVPRLHGRSNAAQLRGDNVAIISGRRVRSYSVTMPVDKFQLTAWPAAAAWAMRCVLPTATYFMFSTMEYRDYDLLP